MRQNAYEGTHGRSQQTWIVSETAAGFRVYSPSQPRQAHLVSGSPSSPVCTCADFQATAETCEHIEAVVSQFGWRQEPDPYEREEREAIQNEGSVLTGAGASPRANGVSKMLIKRSVSPDGRIDSLSVEFSCPIDGAPAGDIKVRAEKTLQLQDEIVQRFLKRNGRGTESPFSETPAGEPDLAQMMSVGGMDGKWGRRLFINFQVNGKTLKLFGTRKQLAEHVRAAGFADYAQHLEEGAVLHLPCRVVTVPSRDGKYLDIDKVLPAMPERRRR